MKTNVCVLFGGVSPEHDISLRSAETVLTFIDREKHNVFPVGITKKGEWFLFGGDNWNELPSHQWESCAKNKTAILSPTCEKILYIFDVNGVRKQPIDVIYPVLHGENGEDGSIQGLAQLAKIPCVGPSLCASAVSMDKAMTKVLCKDLGVPQADWVVVNKYAYEKNQEKWLRKIEEKLVYPVFIKPARTGSSVGVSKAKNREELISGLKNAFAFDEKVLVEEFIKGREIEVAVLGNKDPIAPVCGEIESGVEFYDFEAKYITSTSTTTIPAKISDALSQEVRKYAVRIFSGLGCAGISRVDFFITEEDKICFNEINTLPGFTSVSMYPKMMKYYGLEMKELITEIINFALQQNSI